MKKKFFYKPIMKYYFQVHNSHFVKSNVNTYKTSISNMHFPPTRWSTYLMTVLSGSIQRLISNIKCFIFSIYMHVCTDSIKWSNKRDVIYNGFLNLFSAITIPLNGVNEFRTPLGFCRSNLICIYGYTA